MRILFKNEIELATVTAVNGSLNYPPDAIYHTFLKKKFKSLFDNDALTIDLVAEVPVDSFFMAFHNVTGGTVSFFDGTLTPVGTPLDMTDATDMFIAYFSEIQVKRIIIDVTSTDDQLYIGGVGAGVYTQMPDTLANGFPFEVSDETSITRSASGQTSRNVGPALRSRGFVWEDLSKVEKDALETVVLALGIGKPVYVDLFEGDRTFDPPMFAIVAQPRTVEHAGAYRYRYGMVMRESQ